MPNIDEIKSIVMTVKNRRAHWLLSSRAKNYQTLSKLGLTDQIVFDLILKKLSLGNYISGPLMDNHIPPVAGNVWIFGLILMSTECYLKFQERPSGIIIWISIHEAKYRLIYPYESFPFRQ